MPEIRTLERISQGGIHIAQVDQAQIVIPGDHYDGPYTVTPSDQQQVFPTTYKTMVEDLVVEAIPSNYGKITWNGSVMTIT